MKFGEKKRRWGILLSVLLLLPSLVGCAGGTRRTPATPENLFRDSASRLRSMDSVKGTLLSVMEMGDEEERMSVRWDLDLEMTAKPEAAHVVGTVGLEASGRSENKEVEVYRNRTGAQVTTYSKADGKWVRDDADAEDLLLFGGFEVISSKPQYFRVEPELKTVNGKDCFALKGKLDEELAEELFEGLLDEELTDALELEDVLDLGEADDSLIPCEVDIYRDTILPARIYLDLTALLEATEKEAPENAETGGQLIEMVYEAYNTVNQIEIPKEVLEARDSRDVSADGKKEEDRIVQAQVAEQKEKLGEKWNSYTVQVGDRVLTLPCQISDLEKTGFRLDTEYTPEDFMVDAWEYEMVWFKDSHGNEMSVDLINPTGEDKPVNQCVVGTITVDEYSSGKGGVTIVFPGGIAIGTDLEAVKKAYGEPDEMYESEYVHSCDWYDNKNYYNNCEVDVDPESGKVIRITLSRFQ